MPANAPDQPTVCRGAWTAQRNVPQQEDDERVPGEHARDRLLELVALNLYNYRINQDRVQNDVQLQGLQLDYAIQNASDYRSWAYGAIRAAQVLMGDAYAQQLQDDAERLAHEFPGPRM